jgi:MinD-like ATPase involved in chromosome partitioning or flagellar assembly
MALIAIASDKGAPGVTTAALALAAVWPRPVLLAECDPAGGDLVYRFPAAGGGHLDPRRGVLSLAVMARRGMQPQQLWEHTQKLHGGLDVLAGVTNAEQGAGLNLLWGPIGKVLAALPQADVIADCGRLGADGPLYDLLAEATSVILVTRVHVADVIRLRDRAVAFAAAAHSRGRRGFGVGVVVVADHKKFRASLGEVQHVLAQASAPATVLGGIAHDAKGADLLSGEWGGNLERTALIKTAREVARQLTGNLPPIGAAEPSAYDPAYSPASGRDPDSAPTGPQPLPAQAEFAGQRPDIPPSFRRATTAPPAATAPPAGAPPAPAFPPAAAASAPASPPAAARTPASPSAGARMPAAPNYAPPRPVPVTRRPGPSVVPPAPEPPAPPAPAPTAPAPAAPAPAAHAPAAQPPAAHAPAAQPPAAPAVAGPGSGPGPASPPGVSRSWGSAPRTTFNRVPGGRSGRHHSDQGQPAPPDAVSPPAHQPPVMLPAPPTPASPGPANPAPANPVSANPAPANPVSANPDEPGFSWRTISQPGNGNGTHRADPLRADPLRADPLRADPLRDAPAGDPTIRPAARHAYVPGHPAAPGPARPPMSPLTPPDPAAGPAGEQQLPAAPRPDEPGWDLPSRPTAGPMGSSHPGGG